MASIKNGDVETYLKLLISEELGYEYDDCENPELNRKEDKREKNSQHKQRSRKD